MSYPHAESAEEEFAFALEDEPDVWNNGELHRLQPNDAVAFPAGTAICHAFINNSDREARSIVIGEANKAENCIWYLKNPVYLVTREDLWKPPRAGIWPYDGIPDAVKKGLS